MLAGKVALVTGSTSGIGLAMAEALGEAGATIVLNGLGKPEEIERQRAHLEHQWGRRCLFDGADLTRADQIEAMFARIEQELGGVDILVNNAGMQFTAATEAFPTDRFERIVALNQTAVFHGCRLAIPHMKRRGWGRIISTASVHGLVASVEKIAYVGTKHAVIGMTKVMALELATHNITANAICPGWVRTELVEPQIADRARAAGVSQEEAVGLLLERQPTRQFVQPWHLGQLTVFLCSEAASQITGTAIPVDGGWLAQ